MKKITPIVSIVLAVLFGLGGMMTLLVSLLALTGAGAAGIAESTAGSLFAGTPSFPYLPTVLGAFLLLLLGLLYMAGSYALFTKKPWAGKSVIAVGVAGIVMFVGSVSSGVVANPLELVWSVLYVAFGYSLLKTPRTGKK